MQFFLSIKLTMNNTKNLKLFLPSLIFILSFPFHESCPETNTMTSALSIKDPDSLISPNHVFKFGFFTIDNTTNCYLGVFYAMSEKIVIWVANKDKPLKDSSGIVTISKRGNLLLKNGRNETIWSRNATTSSINTSVQIQDNGNLVLLDISTGNTIWDSFSHPSSVFVPTMRIIDNIRTGYRVIVSAWRNRSDPEYGSYTSGLQAAKVPQIFVWNNGRPHWRSGPWNGQILIGVQDMYSPYLDGFSIVNNGSGAFYFTAPQGRFLMRISLNSSGSLEQTLWNDQTKSWDITWVAPQNDCDVYGKCGPFGSCNAAERPICSCLGGFEPARKEEWERGIWTSGCVRRRQLECERNNGTGGNGDGFLRLQFMKVPDFPEQFAARIEDECRSGCLSNCSCIAYAHDPNIGCMFWSKRLIDMQRFSGVGPDLHIRLAASELDVNECSHPRYNNCSREELCVNTQDSYICLPHHRRLYALLIPLGTGLAVGLLILIAIGFWVWRKLKKIKERKMKQNCFKRNGGLLLQQQISSCRTRLLLELTLFKIEELEKATDKFSENRILGKGGLGTVYKGMLSDGRIVAVKKANIIDDGQVDQFINEVLILSQINHRNIVKLFGCCLETEVPLLVYEYISNGTLSNHLHDAPNISTISWKTRLCIAAEVAGALAYLHSCATTAIFHRDIKSNNILLEQNYKAVISDFGLSRSVSIDKTHLTTLVGGTFGYLDPEYFRSGQLNDKSDVYAFGVVLAEILTGQKAISSTTDDIGLALRFRSAVKEQCLFEILDEVVAREGKEEEIVAGAKLAKRCMKLKARKRPTMKEVSAELDQLWKTNEITGNQESFVWSDPM